MVVFVLVACSGSGGNKTTNTDAGANANTNQQTDQQTDDSGAPTVKFVAAETCHTKKLAGGNSDALFQFELDAPDGTAVTVVFDSSEQGLVVGEGVVKGNKLLVRIPVVAIGETLTLHSISNSANNSETIAPDAVTDLPDPAHTVPDKSAGKCDLDDAESAANGTVNQPNKNNSGAAN